MWEFSSLFLSLWNLSHSAPCRTNLRSWVSIKTSKRYFDVSTKSLGHLWCALCKTKSFWIGAVVFTEVHESLVMLSRVTVMTTYRSWYNQHASLLELCTPVNCSATWNVVFKEDSEADTQSLSQKKKVTVVLRLFIFSFPNRFTPLAVVASWWIKADN